MGLSAAAPETRFAALDGWRGIAALAVCIYHLPLALPWSASPVWRNAELAVDFFFVLSGFVIAHAARAGLPTGEAASAFLARRFFRVWPLHAAVLGLFVLLEAIKLAATLKIALPLEAPPFTGNNTPGSILTNLVFLQAYGLHGATTWNGPSWSISGEFACYVLFTFVTLLLPRRRDVAMAALALGCALVLWRVSDIGIFVTHDFGVPRALMGFAVGTLAHAIRDRFPTGGTVAEIASLAAVALFLATTGTNATSLLAPLVFAGVLLAHAPERGAVSRMLRSAPVQWLGLMSYALYMVHMLVYQGLKMGLKAAEKAAGIGLDRLVLPNRELLAVESPAVLAVAIALGLAGTLALAALLHRLVEAPGIAFGRHVAARLSGQRAEGMAAPPAAARTA
jgi:peptidoglycan/LPS O-acetylase OafA/YrhL